MEQLEQVEQIEGGITSVDGFSAAGITAGIKKVEKSDLAMIFSDTLCTAAGVFTQNQFPAPPLLLDQRHLRKRSGQAIIANSGNANAFTGARGYQDALQMAEATAQALGISTEAVYVASTGVIGAPLPIEKIVGAIPRLASKLSREGGGAAAEAIMTTDTFRKETAWVGAVGRQEIRIGGIAKGSGMIHPNMATMLAFLSTDVAISPPLLQEALRQSVDRSFHCITVDGDTSTNDLVLCFANGRRGKKIESKGKAYRQFVALLEAACLSLAKSIVRDGEGATKLIEIEVVGARSDQAARKVARSVAASSLVKTAFFGEDANWGRIVAAIGNAGVPLRPDQITLTFGEIPLVQRGIYLGKEAESAVARLLKEREIELTIDLHAGKGRSVCWTSDLSLDYVKINADYRS
ncbi:MAG: bifunctional glutamate N-acetyltransferase/amino-acid acetyltransferase ArgJ [Nitrospirae bacterium]|nr:bifunctional glutamate N-acetyltransferase/amino-acid acetyltransferase ArgJ [Candidatus Manganitrophaceae bacterium]